MASAPPELPRADIQDPLPEANWFWRRVFTFVLTAAILWMVWGAITRLGAASLLQPITGIPALLSLCKSLLFIVLVMTTYYMVAPSAEQITKMIQTAGLLRSGVQFASKTTAIETPSGTTTATAATASLPPAPPVPNTAAVPVAPTRSAVPPDPTTYKPPMPEPGAAS